MYENSEIPERNKLKSEEVNSIKNVINQENRYTPTIYENAQYKCNLEGNLEEGDTIQVILDLTIQDDDNDNDIKISIDGGTSYYDLIDTKKGFILKASDFEYLKIYLKAVFNGESFVLISPDRVTNEITLRLSEAYSAPSGLNYYYVNTLDSIYKQKGRRLSLGNITPSGSGSDMSGVKIGEGIDSVEGTGQLQMTNSNETSTMYFTHFLCLVQPDGTMRQMSRSLNYNVLAKGSQTSPLITTLESVNENDIIGLRIYKSMANGTCTVDIEARTYITIKEIR